MGRKSRAARRQTIRETLNIVRRKTKGHSRVNQSVPVSGEKITGKITMTPAGFGFVARDGGPDIFIPPKFVNGAMDGDTVNVALLPPRPEDIESQHGPAGRIVEIVERGRNAIVGEVLAGRKIRPLNKRIAEDIRLSGNLKGAQRGDWVKIKLLETEQNGFKRGLVEENIGKAGSIKGDLDAIMAEYELFDPYTEQQEEEAAALPRQTIKREDFTREFTATIDPEDAKDFDDAISIAGKPGDKTVDIGVHIADVAAWIVRDGFWDKEAAKRAFTAYLPGRTLPMLPRNLTKLISLTPDVDSPAHSVILTVDTDSGKILKTRRCHTMIRVNHRLTYETVQTYLDTGKKPQEWTNEFVAALDLLVSVFRKMRSYRQQTEKFLILDTPEIRVLCDEASEKILGIVHKVQREADELVEECMLAANTAVATELIEKSLPGLFRTHDEPSPDKLQEFSALMAGAFGLSVGDLSSRTACNNFLRNLEDGPKKPVIINAFLRSLPRAVYQADPALHFGLGKTRYSHFTSPIRRYPDLTVHQQLWAADTNTKLRNKKRIEETAAYCTEREMKNDEAWYAANDRMKLRYLQQIMEENPKEAVLHEGMIAKVNAGGLLVDIQDLGIYGFVPLENLVGDYRYHKGEGKLTARFGKRSYKVGDFIYLKLAQIDFIRGQAVFSPV